MTTSQFGSGWVLARTCDSSVSLANRSVGTTPVRLIGLTTNGDSPGDDSWHLVLSAIIHVFLGTLQEVFIILTLTELENMLMYLPTNGYSLCISTSTKLEPHLTPSSEEELNHKPLNNES